MSDYSELKRLAQAALPRDDSPHLPCTVAFDRAASPDVVLALIAENEHLRQQAENRRVDLEELGRKYSALCRHSAQMGRAFHKDVAALRQNSDRYEKLRRLQPGEITGLFIAQQRLMFGKLYYVGPLFGSALDKEVDAIKEAS